MSEVIFPVSFTVLPCGECGTLFALPDCVFEDRKRLEIEIYCPNGHKMEYGAIDSTPSAPTPEPLSAKERREFETMKRQLVQLMHDREQAEGRKAGAE